MKLPILLQSLLPEEHKEFEKFLQSPYFKASPQYLKFFRFLRKNHPSFKLDKAELQAAYRSCFGKQSLTDSKFYNLLSGLGKQVEQFLVVHTFLGDREDSGLRFDAHLIRVLGKRNMGAYFRAEAQDFMERATDQPVHESDHYLVRYQLNKQVYFNPDTPKLSEQNPYLNTAAEQLDLYYCICKLRLVAETKARERILKTRQEIPLLAETMAFASNPELLASHPLLAAYHALVNLFMQTDSVQQFRDTVRRFVESAHLIPRMDQLVLSRHLVNYGIYLNTRMDLEHELLDLYKFVIEHDMLLDGDRLTDSSFINIVNLAISFKEFDWVNAFIKQYGPFLDENKSQVAISLAQANLFYQQGHLDEAQDLLNSAAMFPTPAYDILIRMILLKIAFDRYVMHHRDYEFLISYLRSLERLFQAKPWAEEKITAHINCIRFVRKLTMVKFESLKVSKDLKTTLFQSLKNAHPIVYRKWLEERIELL
jgi:hypothetical protein